MSDTLKVSRNPRYLLRRADEDALWSIEARATHRTIEQEGSPLLFLDPSDAEGWIALHGERGLRR